VRTAGSVLDLDDYLDLDRDAARQRAHADRRAGDAGRDRRTPRRTGRSSR
jgi:hypothetical protein